MTEKKVKTDSTILAALINMRTGIIVAALGLVGIVTVAIINKPAIFSTSPSFSFTGRVLNIKNEERIRGAKVSLEGEGVPPEIFTDSAGMFSFPAADPNKEVRLRIEAKEFDNFDLRVVPAKYQGQQDIRLTPKIESKVELTGTVLDSKENPLQGVKITLDDIAGMAAVETSTDGVFVLKELPRKFGEGVRLRISKEGYQPNPYIEDVVLGKVPPRIKLMRKK
jgi:hypothetical protein